MGKKRWTPLHTRIVLLLAAGAAAACTGCFPAGGSRASRPAPAMEPAGPGADRAAHRARYRKNRIVPPEHYSVLPRPARTNAFREFDDSLYGGLDSQPALPLLPGDAAGGATYAMAAGAHAAAPYPATRAPAAPGAFSASAAAPQGVASETRFYPVEQLVFGGDNGELDSPDVYRLMPRDVISVTVRDHPEFSGRLTLQPDGTVRVPNTPDPVFLRGMTADGAADAIRNSIALYVKGDCVVRVQANRARGGYYFVFGDVRSPGRFPMGMEPITLSDAVMAANFEINPNRLAEDDELGPAFPAASPLGSVAQPRTADMARVMLITPHRSRPVRTTHDLRQALLGMTADNPPVRPGQIVVVPSLDPEKNLSLGLAAPDGSLPPEGLLPGRGFSGANTPARLPEVLPYGAGAGDDASAWSGLSGVEANLSRAYGVQSTTEPARMERFPEEEAVEETEAYAGVVVRDGTVYGENASGFLPGEVIASEVVFEEEIVPGAVVVESVDPAVYGSGAAPPARGRRLRKAPFATAPDAASPEPSRRVHAVDGWEKGF